MKYALLVYDDPDSWHDISTEEKHARHDQYQNVAASAGVIGHYRLRPPQKTITVRVEEDRVVKNGRPPRRDERELPCPLSDRERQPRLRPRARLPDPSRSHRRRRRSLAAYGAVGATRRSRP